MFGKRLVEMTKLDLDRIIAEELQEGANLEFKSGLPTKGAELDPWTAGKNTVGDYARNRLVEEIIAFANAHGGTLILGIDESEDKPSRATKIVPIRNCAELAERLKLQCRDCVEPQIPLLEIVGVPTGEADEGAIMVSVPQSRMSPHRHAISKECYIRRQDRTEKMSMREIQDLTLQVDRGLMHLDREFERRGRSFQEKFSNSYNEHQRPSYALRVTAMPTTPIYVERVANNSAVVPPLASFKATTVDGGTVELFMPHYTSAARPIVRGAQWKSGEPTSQGLLEVFGNGLINYQFMEHPGEDERVVFPGWIMAVVANSLYAIDKFRLAANATAVEYAMEVSLLVWGADFPVARYGGSARPRLGPLRQGDFLMPRYSIGPREEFSRMMSLFERDFWNAAGHDFDDALLVDFSQLAQV